MLPAVVKSVTHRALGGASPTHRALISKLRSRLDYPQAPVDTRIELQRGWPTVNHTRIAAQAIRYRLDLVRNPMLDPNPTQIEQMAGATVAAAEPSVDSAIRRIATAWIHAGIEPELLCQRWSRPAVDHLFHANPCLIDALDDIVRVATRSMAA